jgi:hypothetical protein
VVWWGVVFLGFAPAVATVNAAAQAYPATTIKPIPASAATGVRRSKVFTEKQLPSAVLTPPGIARPAGATA